MLDGPVDGAVVLRVEREVAAEIQEAKVGLVAVPADNANRTGSFFAADFSTGMRDPLWGSAISGLAPARIRCRDRLEIIVHQASSVLLHPGSVAGDHAYLLRPDAGYHTVKLLLECLRALLAESQDGGASYATVFRRRHDPLCGLVLSADAVERLVRRRELFDGDISDLPDAQTVVTRALAAIFGTAADATAVARYVVEAMAERSDLLSAYQVTCVIMFLRERLADQFAADVAGPAVKALWGRVDSSELTAEARTVAAALADLPVMEVISRQEITLNLLRLVRVEYYRLLGDHIFGVRPRADYTDIG
jgi:hypothetical protein